jgi:hypothetical protein
MSQPTKRLEIYKNFKKYVQQKDERTMDNICISETNEFQLQSQQKFLAEYMIAYPNWKKLLLYHQIGSGKTCTSITMAEEYLKTYPNNKINVVLPARLKTNFFDELISPCGFDKYISKEDFIMFNMSSTTAKVKKQIKSKFMKAIEEKYNIISFEKLKIIASKHSDNIVPWIKTFTKDSMLIVDEVHNLMSSTYDNKKYKEIVETGILKKGAVGMNTILFKLITLNADPSAKMVFLTATPVFDNILQLKELVQIMTPEAVIQKNARLSDIIDFLRGKVSYFPGTSINAYPTTEYDIHHVVISKTQDLITKEIQNSLFEETTDENNQFKESFMAKQRQVSIACLPNNKDVKGNIDEVLANISEYAPKIEAMMKVINSSPGKHIIYSNFVQAGLNVVEKLLLNEGWTNIKDVLKSQDLWSTYKGKIFAVWSGDTKDVDKSIIKNIANNKDNIFGDKLRVILGSPSVKEGVSFKHIQHLHLLDPIWNQSAKTQIEGRAIRFCSHVDINEETNKPLRRNVTVDIYKLIPKKYKLLPEQYKKEDKQFLVNETCDQKIYDDIIPKKHELIRAGEKLLRRIAIDNYLFRNLYANKKLQSPKSSDSEKSSIKLLDRDNVFLKNKQKPKTKVSKCPKPRRPDELTKKCADGYYMKLNIHGDECCYKNKKVTKLTKEPKVPKIPKVPKEPKVPKIPKVPKEPKLPKIPKVPKVSKEPKTSN